MKKKLKIRSLKMDYLKELPCLEWAPKPETHQHQQVAMTRTSLNVFGHRVFKVSALLSERECDEIVRGAVALGMKDVGWEYVTTYRRCTRSVSTCPSLAGTLLERLKPLFEREDLDGVQPFGIGADGSWALSYVNSCMRVSCYEAGSHFAKHRDNGFVLTDDVRSIYTIVCYLNDDFTGGETIFYDDKGMSHPVTPSRGQAVVFTVRNFFFAGWLVLRYYFFSLPL